MSGRYPLLPADLLGAFQLAREAFGDVRLVAVTDNEPRPPTPPDQPHLPTGGGDDA